MIASHLQVIQQFDTKPQYKGYLKKKTVVKQKVWEYIRRNKRFRVGDLIIIFDLKLSYAKWLIWNFSKAGVIELIQDNKRFTERFYRLKQDTGIKAPRG